MEHNLISGQTAAQIADSIEAAIHAGTIAAGATLPTVRHLASSLRVSPTTVAAAYKLLRARGVVSAFGRGGTRISLEQRAVAAGSRRTLPDGVVDLATGNPDPDLLPRLDHALAAIAPAPRLYDGPALLPALATFASAELGADGVASGPMTVAGGGLDAIERILREHLRPGDRVGVEDPGYAGIFDVVAANGLSPVPMPMDDEGPLPEALERALRSRVRAVIVTPRAQNPTGAAITTDRARTLRDLLKGSPDVLLVENDPAGPIAGAPLATLCDGSMPRWAFVRSVAKYLGPDLRLALVAGDPSTVARVGGRLSLGTRWVSHLLQQLTLALWSDPAGGRQLARAAEVYRHRREALLTALSTRGIAGRGASGLNVWVPVRNEARVAHDLLDRGWAVMPGERFRLKAAPGIRITTAALPARDAERVAEDVARVVAIRGGAVA